MTHGPEKSDLPIIATKLANKAGQPGAESVERRGRAEGNTEEAGIWQRFEIRVAISPQLIDSERDSDSNSLVKVVRKKKLWTKCTIISY
jgi:hypothetical protein